MDDSSTPFDHLSETDADLAGNKSRPRLFAVIGPTLRGVSAVTLAMAFLSALFILLLHIPHSRELLQSIHLNLPGWCLKSAWPLIFIGISYASLLFTLPHTPAQRLLGLLVCLAFAGWGSEQFISNPSIVSLIDDMIVFLFVLDLSLVIRGHLAVRP